ncbi:MAG: hypothetical protein ACK5W9_13545 [Bdellovibrionales bacterium]
MNANKKKMSLFIVGMVLAQELTYAQAVGSQTPGVGTLPSGVISVGTGTGFLSSGDYNINQTVLDYSKTMEEILKQKNANNQADREYLTAISKRIAQSFQALIQKKREFVQLGERASLNTTNNGVSLTQYLALKNEINAMIDTIRIELQTNTLISRDTLPSNIIKVGNQEIDTGAASIIDMSAAMQTFVNDLEKLIGDLNNVKFTYLQHKNKWGSIESNALNPDLSKFPAMTSEEVQEALTKLQGLQIVSQRTQQMQQFLADQVVRSTTQFLQAAGTDEFLRFRNQNDRQAFQEMYNSIEKFFFMRSYLRRKYGLQIGAIQLAQQYDMAKLNVEALRSKDLLFPVKTALSSLRSQVARTDDDLMAAFNNVRQFVEAYDRRLTPILSEKSAEKRGEILKQAEAQKSSLGEKASFMAKAKIEVQKRFAQAKALFASKEEIQANKPNVTDESGNSVSYNAEDTGIMARLSSLWITATGQQSTVEALLGVMRLVLADIREEVMLSQGEWGSMQSYHFKRFMNGEARTDRAVKTMCEIDNTLSAQARASAKAVTNNRVTCEPPRNGILGNMNNGGTITTTFRNLMGQFERVEVARAVEARNLRELIDQAMAAGLQEGDKIDDSGLFDIPKN